MNNKKLKKKNVASKVRKKISVIIPTLNEEKYLPKLLKSLKEQSFEDYEIIVSDAGSKDRTRAIAEEYGALVVQGGMPGAARNAGAKSASGEFLFFLDADVIVPKDFLENAYSEMRDKYIDLATCDFKPLSDKKLDRFLHRLINAVIRIERKINPEAFGFCILVARRLFERIIGFDESVVLAEDCDFVKRAYMFRPLEILKSTFISVSVRRYIKEGRMGFMIKGLRISIHRIFRGEIRSDVIQYEFGNFDNKKEKGSGKDVDIKKISNKKKILPVKKSAKKKRAN
jgi:Glycosyltransferases, probably involved in cell wall biogenesis